MPTCNTESEAGRPPEEGGPCPSGRRQFLKQAGLGLAGLVAASQAQARSPGFGREMGRIRQPIRKHRGGAAPHGRQRQVPLPEAGVIALNRLGFGPRPGDLEAFRGLGSNDEERLEVYVDRQLDPASIPDPDLEARIEAAGFTTLNKSLEQLWADHHVNNDQGFPGRLLPLREVELATFLRAIYSERQLQEVLADFWHNHFNVFAWDFWPAPVWVHFDRDVIRPNLLGNFRQMLESVATSTAMLFYLDNFTSSNAGPNENFCRELFELHTLGAENYLGIQPQNEVPTDAEGWPIGYVDADVFEATRCLTGWSIDHEPDESNTGTFLYRDGWHDRFQKTVLGNFIPQDQPAMKDGRDVLDILTAHPGTGRHLAGKLCRRFVGETASPDLVQQAAAVFTANVDAPDQLRQVLRVILLSEEFRSTWGEKTKRPFEVATSALRATGTTFTLTPLAPDTDAFLFRYTIMGQDLFAWKTPDGYPDKKESWNTNTPRLMGWRFTNWLVDWQGSGGVHVQDIVAQTPPEVRSANDLADFWIERILGRPMEAPGRQEVVALMALEEDPSLPLALDEEERIKERLRSMVGLILMSPDFHYR